MRDEPVAEHGDRPLGVGVDVREGAPLRAARVTACSVDAALLAQLRDASAAELVVADAVKK